jgi:hypothetical protein
VKRYCNNPSERTRIGLVILAGVLAVCSRGQEGRRMDDLAIATYPKQLSVVSGESLPVRTVIENRGAAPASVPSHDGPSQFDYEIRELREGKNVYRTSLDITSRRRSPDLFRPQPVPPEMLPPKQKAEWEDDLADMLNQGIAPGKYAVKAKLPTNGLESPQAMFSVLAPNLESYSSHLSQGILTSVMAHRRTDGGAELLQRDSLVRDPREGVFYHRQKLGSGKVSAAGSIDVAPAGNGRWMAWLQDRKLTASNGWGSTLMLTTKPLDIDGDLLDPGFQIDVGTALFGVVTRAAGSARLETFVASPKGLERHWSTALGPGPISNARWHWSQEGGLTVVWETAGGTLVRMSFARQGSPTSGLETLARDPVAAWGMRPDGPLSIWMVRRTDSGIQLGLLPARQAYSFAPQPDLRAFGVCETESDVRVVAADASHVWVAGKSGAPWQQVAETSGARFLSAFPMRGCWAEWLDPGYGIRRMRLP